MRIRSIVQLLVICLHVPDMPYMCLLGTQGSRQFSKGAGPEGQHTTHLVCREHDANNPKTKLAKKWGLPIVSPGWCWPVPPGPPERHAYAHTTNKHVHMYAHTAAQQRLPV